MFRPDFLLELSCLTGGALSMPPAPEDELLWSEHNRMRARRWRNKTYSGCAIAVGPGMCRRRDFGTGAGGGVGANGATFCLFARLGVITFAADTASSGDCSRGAGAFRFRDLDVG